MRTQHKPLDQGFVWGQPDWDWLQVANAQLYDGFAAISDEWLAFVGRRVGEDLQLGEELAEAKGPEALWAAYRKFWQKAFEDYWNEYLALGQLYGKISTSGTTAAQQVSERAFPHSRAA